MAVVGLALTVAAGLTVGAVGATAASASAPASASAGERAASWRVADRWTTSAPVTGLDLDPEGGVVVATADRRVRTHAPGGSVRRTFRAPVAPGDLDVAPDGDIHLVPDPDDARATRTMRVLRPGGRLVRTYGRDRLPAFGGFEVSETGGRLVFADGIDDRVRTYDVASGDQVDAWGDNGEDGAGGPEVLGFAADVALLPRRRLVLADVQTEVLNVFDRGGRHVRRMGAAVFSSPVRRVAAGGDRVFGLEPRGSGSQVEVFGLTGGHQRTLRTPLARAVDLAAGPSGDVLYVAGELPSGEPGVVRYVRR